MEDVIYIALCYAVGWFASFYILARWDQRHSGFYTAGLGIAYMATFWPLIFCGVILWFAIDYFFKAVDLIGKPFDKLRAWSVKDMEK